MDLAREAGLEVRDRVLLAAPVLVVAQGDEDGDRLRPPRGDQVVEVGPVVCGHTVEHEVADDDHQRGPLVVVGDLQRIRLYPERGFQIEQRIPEVVWAAFERLVALGYTKNLV